MPKLEVVMLLMGEMDPVGFLLLLLNMAVIVAKVCLRRRRTKNKQEGHVWIFPPCISFWALKKKPCRAECLTPYSNDCLNNRMAIDADRKEFGS